MKIPTPSFFRIRLVVIILCCLIFCFFIGLVKDALSAYPGECTAVIFTKTYKSPGGTGQNLYDFQGVDQTTGMILMDMSYHQNPSTVYWYAVHSLYYENGQWHTVDRTTSKYADHDPPDAVEFPNAYHSVPDWDCSQCTDEQRQQEIEKCAVGGLLYECLFDFDESTCTATCNPPPCYGSEETFLSVAANDCGGAINLDMSRTYWESPCACQSQCHAPCIGPGKETEQEAIQRCQEQDKALAFYYGEPECKGVCSQGCTEYEFQREVERCAPFGLKSFSEITCRGLCDDCAEKEDEAAAECELKRQKLVSYTCDADGDVLPVCRDETDDPEIPPGEPGKDPDDPPQDPPPDKDPQDPGPEDPDNPSENELNAINENLKNLVEQNNDRAGQLQDIANNTKWTGDNAQTIADNTGKTVDAINQLGTKGLLGKEDSKNINRMTKDIDAMDDKLGRMSKNLTEISEGTFTSPGEEDAYSTGEEYSFSDRTSEFLASMRTTGIFSLPDKISSSIPGGGSSTLVINGGGTYGNHTIDFSDYSAAILILRTVFNIAGMIIAIRIITLKR